MKKTKNGKRLFSQQFKISAVRRVLEGEKLGEVSRDLGIGYVLLWGWKKRVKEKGEDHLYNIGARSGQKRKPDRDAVQHLRITELEQLVGRQQLEIGFLERALRQVEEQRQPKNGDGEAASSKR